MRDTGVFAFDLELDALSESSFVVEFSRKKELVLHELLFADWKAQHTSRVCPYQIELSLSRKEGHIFRSIYLKSSQCLTRVGRKLSRDYCSCTAVGCQSDDGRLDESQLSSRVARI